MLGEVIHGYRIDRAMSDDKGGFGDVFFASHVDSGAEAVVKMLKPEMSAMRDIVARFFNEARAAASVHHPGIVQIHNVGYHRERAYLLMERLRGEDLETRLAAGPIPLDRALVFLRQTAGAIGAAHERGIIHRDLKPANLFIVSDPDVIGGERIKVLDFGIAKLTADTGAGKTQGVFGTPAYMSPEQCASTGAVDGRADLYSLGCIFYELVCGRPPFGFGGLELIAAHLRDQPQPPRTIAPWLPPPIEQVILGLLVKQPEHRTQSCAQLIAQLDAVAGTAGMAALSMPRMSASVPAQAQTTLGAAAGAGTQAQPPAGRRLGIWLGAGALAVVAGIVAVVAISGHQAPAALPPTPPAVVDAGVAVVPPAPDATQVAVAPPAPAPDAAQAAAAAAPDAAGAAVAEDPEPPEEATPPAADGSGSGSGSAHRRRRHHDPQAADLIATGSAAASTATGTSVAEIAARLNDEGKELMYSNAYAEAAQKFRQAIARAREPKYFFNLCVALTNQGQFNEALTACNSAIDPAYGGAPELRGKVDQLSAKIRQLAQQQGIELQH